jgi:hypothetical protein
VKLLAAVSNRAAELAAPILAAAWAASAAPALAALELERGLAALAPEQGPEPELEPA